MRYSLIVAYNRIGQCSQSLKKLKTREDVKIHFRDEIFRDVPGKLQGNWDRVVSYASTACYFGYAWRLGAVLIKNQYSASGREINEKNHSIAELEAGFVHIKYASLS